MKLKDFCHVNSNLLPFKFHFFFVYAGYAGVLPFMPVIAKHLGINATAFGIGFSMIPIFIFLSNPLIGFVVDYFQNIKVFLSLLLLASVASIFSVLIIPKINYNSEAIYIRVSYLSESGPVINISEPLERTCFEELIGKEMECKLGFDDNFVQSNNSKSILTSLNIPPNNLDKTNQSEYAYEIADDKLWMTFYLVNVSLPDTTDQIPSLKLLHCSPNITKCSLKDKVSFVLSSYQFWAFITAAVVGAVTSTSVMTLSSVGCYERLGMNVEVYGRQRLFGTISWGLVCTLTGISNDISKTFLPGFYLMAIFISIDVIILCIIDIPKANISSSMCKDLGKIFSSKEILMFALGVVFVGFFNAIIAVYEFWYLEDMGAKQKLLGLTVAVQCLVGEVPFLFFSGWFVNKLGHYLCVVCVFSAFAIRLTSYSVIRNPWFVLPVDSLHGITFGLYHGAMTSFAKAKAPKGMEATLLGIFGGLYDGLGYGLGSFIGGIGLDNFGSRTTFFITGMISFGCILIFSVASYAFRTRVEKTISQDIPSEMKNKPCVE